MSNYSKSTDFAAKDALISGSPAKVVKGTEIDTEFNNIASAISSKADTTALSGYLDASAIGTTVQAYDADLTSWAGIAPTAKQDTITAVGVLKGSGSAVSAATAGTDYVAPNVATAFTAQQTFQEVKDTVYTITDGAAFEIDPANGSIQVVTLGAARTPAATNFEAGQIVLLGIDDGSAYSVTWTTVAPTWVKAGGTGAAPALATTGYTWVLLWKVGSTIYASEVGKP